LSDVVLVIAEKYVQIIVFS